MDSSEHYNTKPLSDFYPELCNDRRVKAAFKQAFGSRAKTVIEALISGEDLESVLTGDDGDPEEIISELVSQEFEEVETILGAASYDDEFPIDIMKFRNVYWIAASEFEPIGYFGDVMDAVSCVTSEYEAAITALNERDDQGDE
jgi:hypothetical protein